MSEGTHVRAYGNWRPAAERGDGAGARRRGARSTCMQRSTVIEPEFINISHTDSYNLYPTCVPSFIGLALMFTSRGITTGCT